VDEESTMTKEQIFEVVKNHIVDTLEDVDAAKIDATKSMKELGANSLDIVEIVSCSMRELKVKVPRSELAKLTNIQELVDLLHQVLQQGPQPTAN
jgi:acyl carrier protein